MHSLTCTAIATEPATQSFNTIYVPRGSPDKLASWGASSGMTACNMTGVVCDNQANVVPLSLYKIPTGIFDPLLFSLTSLTSLAMVEVNLVGVIPAQNSQLLQMPRASNNLHGGSLPLSMSTLVSNNAREQHQRCNCLRSNGRQCSQMIDVHKDIR